MSIVFDRSSLSASNYQYVYNSSSKDFISNTKISPDGFKLLCTTEHNDYLIFYLNYLSKSFYPINSSANTDEDSHNIPPSVSLLSSQSVGEAIYDTQWYPTSNCFITASRDHPIHLWDASNGNLITTFIMIILYFV